MIIDTSEMKIGANPCPSCRERGGDKRGNNFHFYGDGRGGYCFSCGSTVLSDDEIAARGLNAFEWTDEMEMVMSKRERLTAEEVGKIRNQTTEHGKLSRGISDETYKKYRVRFGCDEQTGDVNSHYYPYTEEYQASGYKLRKLPKEFTVVGKLSGDSDLFGQVFFRNASGKFVVLCAGEIDTLSAYQMLNANKSDKFDDIPCVSAGTGENGSHKNIAKHYSWFDRFEKIIVIYDQDDTGRKAVRNLTKVLPKGKMYVVDLPMKDINAMLEAGKQQEFTNSFWKAKHFTPEGIVSSADVMNSIVEHAQIDKIPLPPFMHNIQRLFAGGVPLGVIVNLGGASGQGKSTIADEILYYWIFESPYKVGILSLESDVGSYGTKLLSRHIEQKIDLIVDKEEKLKLLTSEETTTKANELWNKPDGSARFYLIDERDGGINSVKSQITKMIVECECKVVVIDPATDLIDSLTNEQQAEFMSWQKGMVKSHKVTFLNILHTRKTGQGQKAGSAGADLHEEDFHGNSSLYKSAAANILFSRNKEAEDEIERNTMYLKLSKCRWTGNTSPVAGKYYYDNNKHRLYDFDDYFQSQTCDF